MTRDELEALARKAEHEAQDLRERVKKYDAEVLAQRRDGLKPLVILAHDTLCRWNHTDGCSWGYEMNSDGSHNWQGWAHARWLKHLDDLVNPYPGGRDKPLSPEVIEKLIHAVRELRKIDDSALWILRYRLEPQ